MQTKITQKHISTHVYENTCVDITITQYTNTHTNTHTHTYTHIHLYIHPHRIPVKLYSLYTNSHIQCYIYIMIS